MDLSALGRVVGEMVLAGFCETGDGGYVYYGSGVAVLVFGCFLEEGEEGGGHEEALRDVCAVGVCPVVECCVIVFEEILLHFFSGFSFCWLGVAGNAGVVDKYAEALFSRFNLFYQARDVGLGSDVCYEGDYLAWDVLSVGFDYSFQLLLCSAYNVDFGTVDG